MTEIEPVEWQARLRAAVAETLRTREAGREERAATKRRRDYGVAQRHAAKAARLDAAAVIDTTGSRCRFLVAEEPPVLCPNERLPGAELCRPHLTRVTLLARRLGLDLS